MILTPELITSITALVVAVLTAIGGFIGVRAAIGERKRLETITARKDTLEELRGEVTRLSVRVDELTVENFGLHNEINRLRSRNAALETILRSRGIEIPEDA